MGFYDDRILPHLFELALGTEIVATERSRALSGVRGDVLEVGFGTGLNLPHYGSEVRKLVAIEPSRSVSRLAEKRIAAAPFPVELVGLTGEAIDAPSDSFDSVVSTFTLCSIADVSTALASMRRVLKPEGRLYFLEHGLAPLPRVARMQRFLNPFWSPLAGGCQLDRPIDRSIEDAGFRMESIERYFAPGPKSFSYLYRGVASVISK